MNFRNFSIGNQLFIGFSAIVVAVLMLGLVSNNQAIVLHEQTEKLYNHPLVVRRAISEVEIGIYKMRLATRDFMLATTDKEREKAKMDGLYAEQNIQLNFEVIYKSYLGSKEDIDNARTAFNVWNNARQQNFEYILNGDVEQAKQSFSNEGNVGVLRNDLINKIIVGTNYTFYVDQSVAETLSGTSLGIRIIELNGQTIYKESNITNFIGGGIFIALGVLTAMLFIYVKRKKNGI